MAGAAAAAQRAKKGTSGEKELGAAVFGTAEGGAYKAAARRGRAHMWRVQCGGGVRLALRRAGGRWGGAVQVARRACGAGAAQEVRRAGSAAGGQAARAARRSACNATAQHCSSGDQQPGSPAGPQQAKRALREDTGMPVHLLTISAMSSSVTSLCSMRLVWGQGRGGVVAAGAARVPCEV